MLILLAKWRLTRRGERGVGWMGGPLWSPAYLVLEFANNIDVCMKGPGRGRRQAHAPTVPQGACYVVSRGGRDVTLPPPWGEWGWLITAELAASEPIYTYDRGGSAVRPGTFALPLHDRRLDRLCVLSQAIWLLRCNTVPYPRP